MTEPTHRAYPDMWMDPQDDPRETGAAGVGERGVLLDYLRAYRMTFEMKCSGLDAEQLARRSVPPSTMSLLGLLRHLAKVEHTWSRRCLQGQDLPRLYWSEDDRDLDFNGATPDEEVAQDAWASWRREITHAEKVQSDLDDDLGSAVTWNGDEIAVRDLLVHMIEEYARHCGHADLLRECIDGRTGQ